MFYYYLIITDSCAFEYDTNKTRLLSALPPHLLLASNKGMATLPGAKFISKSSMQVDFYCFIVSVS